MQRLLNILTLLLAFLFLTSGVLIVNGHRYASGTPSLPTSGLVAYYEGTSGATTSQWNDLSGNSRHLTQATAGNRGTFSSPAFTFTNAPQYMSFTGTTGLSQPYTVYFVVSIANTSSLTYIYFDGSVAGSTAFNAFGCNSGNIFLSNDGSTTLTTTAPANNTYALVRCYYNGASSEIQINNGSIITGTGGTHAFSGKIYLGSDAAFGAGTFSIKAMYFYTGKPTHSAVTAYTTPKWGLP